MAYLYRHIRLDKNEPFYIGIGSDDNGIFRRAFSIKYGRNLLHQNILNKTLVDVEIILDNLTWEDACKKEKEFIKLYGRKDLGTGCLCNLTDGGEGTVNRINSKESNIKRSESLKGRIISEHSKEKNRQSHIGKIESEESNKKKSAALKLYYSKNPHHSKGKSSWNKGKAMSAETKEKLSKANKGKCKHSPETKLKISESLKLRKRKLHSEESNQTMRESS